MESTSCRENCPFVKQGFCHSYKECPNHIETWWIKSDSEQPIKLEDCSPKRMVLQQQTLQSKLDLTMQALVESRNEYNILSTNLKNMIEMAKQVILNNDQKDIQEIKNEHDEIFIPHHGVFLSD